MTNYINKIICGDCIKVLKTFPENSIDTIITDPPYGIEFMGKIWDSSHPPKEIWQEVLRVAKPGATLLCFGGTRTYHRLACAIEDAGWIIKDCIMWLYGSGFPKATDISKQLDKRAGKLKVVGKRGGGMSKTAMKPDKGWNANQMGPEVDITEPNTEEAQLWNGWKSHGLKPAYEPIIMAMKPNEGSYAENALKYGVSGLNIDGGRIGTGEDKIKGGCKESDRGWNKLTNSNKAEATAHIYSIGRFPANLILDEEAAELLDEQSGESGSGSFKKGSYRHKAPNNLYQLGTTKKEGALQNAPDDYGDTGGASRFFKVIK